MHLYHHLISEIKNLSFKCHISLGSKAQKFKWLIGWRVEYFDRYLLLWLISWMLKLFLKGFSYSSSLELKAIEL